jgi:hypothetical protein
VRSLLLGLQRGAWGRLLRQNRSSLCSNFSRKLKLAAYEEAERLVEEAIGKFSTVEGELRKRPRDFVLSKISITVIYIRS